jgi:hypothetical protein
VLSAWLALREHLDVPLLLKHGMCACEALFMWMDLHRKDKCFRP